MSNKSFHAKTKGETLVLGGKKGKHTKLRPLGGERTHNTKASNPPPAKLCKGEKTGRNKSPLETAHPMKGKSPEAAANRKSHHTKKKKN